MNYLLILLIVAVAAYLLLMIRSELKHRKRKKSRISKTLADFTAEFEDLEIANAKAIELVYGDLEKLVGYPVSIEDDLEQTLGLLPEDFEDSLEKRARTLGVENIWESPYTQRFPLRTVGDYVLFLDEILKGEARQRGN